MTSQLDSMLLLLAALGAGLNAGFFFAFSIVVMPALDRLPTAEGASAMQVINKIVLNPWFFAIFFGASLLCLALLMTMTGDLGTPRGKCAIAGAALFLVGTLGVTMARNVPMNEELARHDANSEGMSRVWRRFMRKWTLWNHVRTIAPAAACVFFILALVQPA